MLVLGLLAGGLAIGLREISAFAWLEHRTLQARFSVRGEQAPSPEIVVVALDAASIGLVDRYPVPRQYDAQVVDRLGDAGASAVVFDFKLEEPTDDEPADLTLADALRRTGAAAVAVTTIRPGGRTEPLVGRHPFDGTRVRPGNISQPSEDGVVSRFPTSVRDVPPLAIVAASLHDRRTRAADPPDGALIDFPGQARTVPTLSFADVLSGAFPARSVAGKIVVVGPTAAEAGDLHTPAVGGSPMAGPEILANQIATALDGYPLRTTSSPVIAMLLLGLALAVSLLLCLRLRKTRVTAMAIAVAGTIVFAMWTVGTQIAFNAGAVIDYSAGAFSVLVSCMGAGVLTAITGRRERREVDELRKLFADYSPDVVRRILDQGSAEPAVLARTEIIKGYRIEHVIGRGGMGVVYLATELALERPVALKLIRPQQALSPLFRARFERESQAAAKVTHPSIVPVYAAGQDEGLLYIAMMFVDGIDLARTIKLFGPLEPEMLVTVLRQVASALDAAHGHGLVHRDVKPANILVTADPHHAYLTDFGIAKHVGARERLTDGHGWVGTTDYLAPEIADGVEASARSDVYALTAVLYECVAGTVPFDLLNETAKLRAHADTPPPPVSEAGGPAALDGVIAKGMAKEPAARYATASELANAAARALGFEDTPTRPPRPKPAAPLPDDAATEATG